MKFFKKIDDKIKSFLENKIQELDKKNEELKIEKQERKTISNHSKIDSNVLQKISQLKTFKTLKIKDYGLFFMDLFEELKKSEVVETINKNYFLDLFWLIGLATQGRIEEINDILENNEIENTDFFKTTNNYKPQLLKMAKISKKIEDSNIDDDLKSGETIGEYISRKKLSKSKVFMNEFDYFKNLDYDSLF